MVRIFVPLALLGTAVLAVTLVLGLSIDDPRMKTEAAQASVQYHFLTALAALCFATLVHALVLTYFMGTGRWIEETSNAYRLPRTFHDQNQRIKYRTIPAMIGAFSLLLFTGALGAAADPASPMQSSGWMGFSAATVHLIVACTAVLANCVANYVEFVALEKNGAIVEGVLAEVRRIRQEKGLAV